MCSSNLPTACMAAPLSSLRSFLIFQKRNITRLAYAAPSWHSFASARDLARVEGFMPWFMRWGMCMPSTPPFKVYCEDYDARLFKSVRSSPYHTLHHLFHIKPACGYSPRPRAHNYVIPRIASKLVESNFSIRILRDYA